jgi:hypothetical protein
MYVAMSVSFDWWMSAEWAARPLQPILPTSTNYCIIRAAGTKGVKCGIENFTNNFTNNN